MRVARWIATGFGIGYVPIFPGTAASFFAFLLFLFFRQLPPIYYGLLLLFAIFGGVFVADRSESFFGKKDPGAIVIDEIAAVLLVLPFLPAFFGWWIAGVVLFRFFDIAKPPPIRLFERLPGGWGVMADDLAAGGYTLLSLWIVQIIFQRLEPYV